MNKFKDQEITDIGNNPEDIKVLPIEECDDSIVEVKPEENIFIDPQYYALGLTSAPNAIYVRQGVLQALREVAGTLPKGINLLLWDGLRTLETQKELFDQTKRQFEDLGIVDDIEQYLSLPPSSEDEFMAFPPPHATGGAIDLTLCNDEGRPLKMGAEFDEFRDHAWLAYFEDDRSKEYGEDAFLYRDNRRLLYWAMRSKGFSPYPWEYWHFELGTTVWANFKGFTHARYGAATPWKRL